MLSISSGFTTDQATRYKAMFHVLLCGVVILILGVGILCFGRMYGFDSSRYDLFMVFGVMIVVVAAVAITVPVCCQLKIYLEVQGAKGEGSDYPTYAPVAIAQQQQQQQQQKQQPALSQVHNAPAYGYRPATLQFGTAGGPNQPLPFSSAAYMMGQQQPRGDPRLQRQINESLMGRDEPSDPMRQGRSPIWSSAGAAEKQEPI